MNIELTEEECLVLFEFFERADEKDELYFIHPAEYIVIQNIHAQICKGTTAMFQESYFEYLNNARENLAQGFKGKVPGLRNEENT